MSIPKIEHIYVDEEIRSHPFTKEILSRLPQVSMSIFTDPESAKEALKKLPLNVGKRRIWLTTFKGNQVKLCPGTDQSYVCCNYHVVNETTNCPLECTYCILQAYLNNPVLTVYVNVDDMFRDIEALISRDPERVWRIGTGELADSLALDPITKLSEKLVRRFAYVKNLLFELKTKTINTDYLPNPGPNNFVISWSLNPSEIVESEELKTATAEERINQARIIQDNGYLLGFHFDPIIYHEGWQKNYLGLIKRMKEKLDPTRIAWISMGSFRYPPHLKGIIAERFPNSNIIYAEDVTGKDGKKRYMRQIREKMFESLYQQLRAWDKDLFVYFCMESSIIWKKVMNVAPKDSGELDYMFAKSLQHRFPELELVVNEKSTYQDDRNKT